MKHPSVLFVVRGDNTVPSCRFRAWQWKEPLERLGVEVGFLVIEKRRALGPQLRFHAELLRQARAHTAVVYQKLLEPLRIRLAALGNRRLFFDFDDAMYISGSEARFARTLRAAPRVIAGNEILAARARRYHRDVAIIPTTVLMPPEVPFRDVADGLRLSWVGTSDNLRYLAPALAAVRALRGRGRDVRLHVLTERPERMPPEDGVEVERWSHAAEDRALRGCHVGLMPLEDDEWSRGKCACKALQYLSYGKPVISSPVGVNAEIFDGAEFGRLAQGPADWQAAIEDLDGRRAELGARGRAGRAYVAERYAVDVWAPRLRDTLFGEGR